MTATIITGGSAPDPVLEVLPEVGAVFETPPRMMTRERMRWYCDALETAADADGEFKIAEPTIHTDDDYARSQGLSGIIADGMISTNWMSGLLIRLFGMDYVGHGELQTTFIRPVYEDEVLVVRAVVSAIDAPTDGGDVPLVTLDLECLVDGGEPCTVGFAKVPFGAVATGGVRRAAA